MSITGSLTINNSDLQAMVGSWMNANLATYLKANPAQLNAAVAAYLKANPPAANAEGDLDGGNA